MGAYAGFEVDLSEFKKLYEGMTGKEVLTAKKATLRAGSRVIATEAKIRMKATKYKITKRLLDRVRYAVNRKGYVSTIHLFGNIPESATAGERGILVYMEKGARWTHGGPKRGNKERPKRKRNRPVKEWRMEGTKFLSTATTTKKAAAEAKMRSVMLAQIDKIYKRFRD
jgi:hypothetical protein